MQAGRLRGLVSLVTRLRAAATDTAAGRRIASIVAVGAFALVLYLSRGSIPARSEIDVGVALVSVLVVSPVMVAWMAAQFLLAGRLTGQRIPAGEAARVAVLSGAANLLPIPGSVIIRAQALRSRGVSTADAGLASALVGVAWLGSSGLLAAVVTGPSEPLVAVVAAGLGAGSLGAYGLGVRRLAAADRARLWWIGSAQGLGMAVTAAANLALMVEALGYDAPLSSVVVVSTSGVISAAIGIFPGGLGLREALAAALSSITDDLSPAEGSVAAATVHLSIVGVLFVAAVAVLFRPYRHTLDASEVDRASPATVRDRESS